MATKEEFQGVSKCYVFKSRLQEYAQKVGIKTPVYETTKEGPSHEPSFKSTVILNDVRYDSLVGFTNRKAAEQSAAEVALMELSKSSDAARCIAQPVPEIGLCKNLLQEYAQKMNYAVPLYQCQRETSSGKGQLFSCTVEIGGIRYIGAAATTKKEAEIKVARTAVLALWLSNSESPVGSVGSSELTVLPSKRKRPETEQTSIEPKRKRTSSRKRKFQRNFLQDKPGQTEVEIGAPGSNSNECIKSMIAEAMPQDSISGDFPCANNDNEQHGPSIASDFTTGRNASGHVVSDSPSLGNITTLGTEVNMTSAVEPMPAEAMPQEDVPHANNVTTEYGPSTASDFTNGSNVGGDVGSDSPSCGNMTTLGMEVNVVSAVKPMTAEAMPHEDIPRANNSTEHGPSTASDFINRSNAGGDVGSVSLFTGNITAPAKEINIVSSVKPMTAETVPQDSVLEDVPHATNANAEHGLSTASDVTNYFGWDVSSITLPEGVNMVSVEPCLEAASVMPGPDQSH